jgi:acetyltransferase-like isoleucine patch superfamily enzyme
LSGLAIGRGPSASTAFIVRYFANGGDANINLNLEAGRMRKLLLLLAVVLPKRLKPAYYRRFLGWKIGSRVRIGLSLIDSEKVEIGDDVHIGHFNVFRELKELSIASNAWVSNFNELYGGRSNPIGFPCRLIIGRGAKIMSHHFIDAVGTVVIGDRATLGGRGIQVWSHSFRIHADGVDSVDPITLQIHQDAYVGARATIVLSDIPAGAIVGACAVVTRSFAQESGRVLISGNPAQVLKRYPANPAWADAPVNPA